MLLVMRKRWDAEGWSRVISLLPKVPVVSLLILNRLQLDCLCCIFICLLMQSAHFQSTSIGLLMLHVYLLTYAVRHCGLVVSAPAWDGTGWVRFLACCPCSLSLRLLGSYSGYICSLLMQLALETCVFCLFIWSTHVSEFSLVNQAWHSHSYKILIFKTENLFIIDHKTYSSVLETCSTRLKCYITNKKVNEIFELCIFLLSGSSERVRRVCFQRNSRYPRVLFEPTTKQPIRWAGKLFMINSYILNEWRMNHTILYILIELLSHLLQLLNMFHHDL